MFGKNVKKKLHIRKATQATDVSKLPTGEPSEKQGEAAALASEGGSGAKQGPLRSSVGQVNELTDFDFGGNLFQKRASAKTQFTKAYNKCCEQIDNVEFYKEEVIKESITEAQRKYSVLNGYHSSYISWYTNCYKKLPEKEFKYTFECTKNLKKLISTFGSIPKNKFDSAKTGRVTRQRTVRPNPLENLASPARPKLVTPFVLSPISIDQPVPIPEAIDPVSKQPIDPSQATGPIQLVNPEKEKEPEGAEALKTPEKEADHSDRSRRSSFSVISSQENTPENSPPTFVTPVRRTSLPEAYATPGPIPSVVKRRPVRDLDKTYQYIPFDSDDSKNPSREQSFREEQEEGAGGGEEHGTHR